MNGGNRALLCSCWRENVGTIKPWKRNRAVFLHFFGHGNFYTVCFIHSEWMKCYFTSDIFSFLLWSFGYMEAWFWGWYFLCIEDTGVCLLASTTSLYLLGAKLKKILKTQQLLFGHSVVSNSETPWTAARQASLSFTISQSLLKLTSIESVIPSNHLILCHPLLLLPSIFPSVRIFAVSQLFTSGGQSIGASASESVLMYIHGWFPLVLTGWSACSPRDSQESSSVPQLESNNGCRNIFLSFKQYLEKCLQKIGFQTQVWISII